MGYMTPRGSDGSGGDAGSDDGVVLGPPCLDVITTAIRFASSDLRAMKGIEE